MKIEELRSKITPLTKKNNIIKVTQIIQVTTLKNMLIKKVNNSFKSQLIDIKPQKKNILYFMMGR